MNNIWTIACWDDWEGLYDPTGKLVYENHSIPIHVLANYMNLPLDEIWPEEIEGASGFPGTLDELETE